MAKALTKSQIVAAIADKAEISKKQVKASLEALTELAYKNAKNGFTIPGIGKLVLVQRKARMGRNPATGESSPTSRRAMASSGMESVISREREARRLSVASAAAKLRAARRPALAKNLHPNAHATRNAAPSATIPAAKTP